MSESLANEEVNEHHENTSSHRVQPTAGIAIPENEEVIDVRELFRSPITLFRFFEPLYRRVAFPSSSPDADAAFVSLQNAIELHQRWEAACFLCIIYAFHRIDVDTARDLASFLMPWILILIGQSESRNPLRAVLTLAPEDRPYVHYVLGLMVLKDLGLSKGLPPTPESFHQGVHHLLEFSAQPFEYAPAFFQAAMALESSPMGDVPTAICLYARAVKAGGIPSACYRLATYYFDKKLREGYKSVVLQQVPDDEAALELLKTAAEKGHEGAQLEYVTRCLAKINLAPPILAMSFAPNAPPETVIAMLTSTPSTKDIEHIAKRMADDVEALTNCIVYLSVQLSPAAVMPRLVTLDELDTHRDSPYLLYQFAQCQEKLAAYTSIDSEDDPAAQALVREYTSTAILAYHRALLVQPNELHLPSALRLYNFFCQEGEGLEVDVDGSKRILPVFPDLGRNMERYDRDIARGGLGIDGSSISGSTADANNDTILVDWPLKRWTFLQRLMPRASMVGTIAGAGEVQFVVGNCYESGLVAAHGQILVTPDLFAAIRAWKKAVKYEYAPAMFKLVPYYTEGVEYTNAYEHYGGSGSGSGNGSGSGGGSGHESSIKKNVLLANQYLYRAAEYGIGDAQYAMGVKEEEEALRSASKQAQRITSFSATSMQNLLQALPTEATAEATTAGETAAEDSNTTRPTSLSRTTSASSSSMVNMWALIHHPHFVLAKQWYLRGVQQSGHAHCKAALLRIVQLEQQAAVQQSHQRQSLSRLRSPPLTPSGGATTASTAPTSSSSSQSNLLPRTPSASLGDAPTPRTATAAASVVAASVASSSTHEVTVHERERGVLVPLVSQPSFDDLPVVEETGEDDEAVGGGGPAVISPASSASASASGSRSFHMAAPGINLMADHHPASPNASSQAMVPRVGSSDSAMAAVATAVPIQRASSSESIPSSTQQVAATAIVATVVASPTPAAPTPTGAIGHTVQHPSPHHQQHQSLAHHGSSPAMAQHMVYDPATAAAYPATPPHHHPHHHLPPSPQPTMMYYAASPTSPPPHQPHQPQLYPLHPGQMVAGYYYPPVDPHYAAMSQQQHPTAYGGHHHSPSAYGGYAPAANASMMSMPPPSSPPPSTTSGTSTSTTTTQQSSNDAHPVPYYVEHYRQHHSQPAPPHHHH